ncbi:hypothetical protein ACX0G9_25770 [Flavitalea flava]
MYTTIVKDQDQALCHLFFHCCLEDEIFTGREMDDLSEKLVLLGLTPRMAVKEELIRYRSYKPSITDEQEYIRYLILKINPVNDLALFSYCTELCLNNPSIDPKVESLLIKIGTALAIASSEQTLIKKLVAQRKAVELQKIF